MAQQGFIDFELRREARRTVREHMVALQKREAKTVNAVSDEVVGCYDQILQILSTWLIQLERDNQLDRLTQIIPSEGAATVTAWEEYQEAQTRWLGATANLDLMNKTLNEIEPSYFRRFGPLRPPDKAPLIEHALKEVAVAEQNLLQADRNRGSSARTFEDVVANALERLCREIDNLSSEPQIVGRALEETQRRAQAIQALWSDKELADRLDLTEVVQLLRLLSREEARDV